MLQNASFAMCMCPGMPFTGASVARPTLAFLPLPPPPWCKRKVGSVRVPCVSSLIRSRSTLHTTFSIEGLLGGPDG